MGDGGIAKGFLPEISETGLHFCYIGSQLIPGDKGIRVLFRLVYRTWEMNYCHFVCMLKTLDTISKFSMGEVRDRYGGAHLHTGHALRRFPEDPIDDVVEQRRGKGIALADARVDFK